MLEVFVGNTSPSLTDTITIDGAAVDLTGASVKLQMRLATSSTLKVDHAATIVTPASGDVQYDWQAGDTDTAGLYRAWWHVTFAGGAVQDTPEFDLEIVAHAPDTTALCSIDDVRLAMELPETATSIDPLILEYIIEASSQIIKHTARQFIPEGTLNSPVTKRFKVVGPRNRVDFYPYDLQQLVDPVGGSAVLLHPEQQQRALTGTDYELRPLVRWEDDPCYTSMMVSPWIPIISTVFLKYGSAYCDVTGIWGFPSIPENVKRATVIAVRSWLRRDQQTYSNFIQQQDTDLIPKPVGTYALPYASCDLLKRYERWPKAV